MGDSEEETFRKLSEGLESDPDFTPPSPSEVQARQFLGDAGYDAIVAKNAMDVTLDSGLKAAGIDLMVARAHLNRTIAGSIVWIALAGTAFGIYFAIR